LGGASGVIWKGDTLIAGVGAVLAKLRARGKRCFFVTNNSTKSRAGYKAKFDSLGLDVAAEEILSSSFAAAAYLEQTNFKASGAPPPPLFFAPPLPIQRRPHAQHSPL
jgi:4-nitrophenyl phosphatase/phosphoglycolate phosphatase